jgi:hypothetical protein
MRRTSCACWRRYDVRLRSVPFERAWASRVQSHITVDGVRVPLLILGLQDLRRAKQEAGRPKDLDDLQHLPKACETGGACCDWDAATLHPGPQVASWCAPPHHRARHRAVRRQAGCTDRAHGRTGWVRADPGCDQRRRERRRRRDPVGHLRRVHAREGPHADRGAGSDRRRVHDDDPDCRCHGAAAAHERSPRRAALSRQHAARAVRDARPRRHGVLRRSARSRASATASRRRPGCSCRTRASPCSGAS